MTLAVCFAVFVRLPNKLGQDHWSQSFWKRSCFAAFCSLLRSTVHIHVLPPMKYFYYKKQYCFYFCHHYINQLNYFKAGKSLHGWLYVYHTRSGLLLKRPSRFRKIKLILSLIKLYLLLLNLYMNFSNFWEQTMKHPVTDKSTVWKSCDDHTGAQLITTDHSWSCNGNELCTCLGVFMHWPQAVILKTIRVCYTNY